MVLNGSACHNNVLLLYIICLYTYEGLLCVLRNCKLYRNLLFLLLFVFQLSKKYKFFVTPLFGIGMSTEISKKLLSVYTGTEYRKNTEWPTLLIVTSKVQTWNMKRWKKRRGVIKSINFPDILQFYLQAFILNTSDKLSIINLEKPK